MNGVINVLKPTGMTSFDVVAYLRRILKIKKVGHTGTLDPCAAGVLPVCLGKATKAVEFLIDKDKIYRAGLKLGISTDTQDATGKIIKESPVDVSKDEIERAIMSFVGKYSQVPPMYSAIKVNGKKLYDIAREGKVIDRKPREVEIYSIDIIQIKKDSVIFDVECSKGTYIRTLCDDIGNKLGCGGHMSFLLRKKAGVFDLSTTLTLEEIRELAAQGTLQEKIIPVDEIFKDYDKIVLNLKDTKKFTNGAKIKISDEFKKKKNLRVYGWDGKFLAFGQVIKFNEDILLKSRKMFI
ncbi:tRNA pseudouridine(55) synthase TruB [Acetivibrio saccincola]|jgi:tRNA pseudouridine55 synthase|uniref:tRNA pseudouridine synthase B n=1 Tax=Acetivibrio saccincola TaxID=1677857 RepID=A0A2K9E6L3_9FIRM|nr:tRNA pseudouridine(55) synthase TruB [Acetivibrio saccincola]AUG58028.1 tRNA pseudouridine synthase B [Acetivibrio saccincola]NLW28183.1 tRNA pseudouridine(55) synthase TruB [Acetivibrio saccincola]PQQ68381.1 tRNA pseudouridine(55) synthase TruB [Acetivibrio saccincola]HOA96335.1 tRNA pseudouridine(55) synthase TruB [Acetivibrio saccincola]HQD28547.1 tRNA pseudouridine(55) synthase TruB [Acetivibrio saccincola]